MSRIARSHPSLRGLATLAALAALAGGCADAGPVTAPAAPAAPGAAPAASTTIETETALYQDDYLERLARFRTRPNLTIAWAKKWIGPEGGRLDFHGFAVDVPAGAVDRTTLFSIRLPVDPKGSERVVAEFGPHNKTFALPVAIELPVRGTTAENAPMPTVIWLDDGWVPVGGTLTADGARLRVERPHFSTYGVAGDDRGGTPTMSGG